MNEVTIEYSFKGNSEILYHTDYFENHIDEVSIGYKFESDNDFLVDIYNITIKKQNKMGYNNNNNNYRGNNNYRSNNNKPQKKHSGAQSGVTQKKNNHKGGKIWVNAWNFSKRRGLVTVSAIENRKSVKSTSKNGNKFITMMFECFYKDSGNTVLEVANFNTNSGKVYLDKLGMVISCKAPNGGYFGQIKR